MHISKSDGSHGMNGNFLKLVGMFMVAWGWYLLRSVVMALLECQGCLLSQVSVVGLKWPGVWVWSLDVWCCEGHSTEVTIHLRLGGGLSLSSRTAICLPPGSESQLQTGWQFLVESHPLVAVRGNNWPPRVKGLVEVRTE